MEMTEEICGAKLYVPGPHFEAKLAVVQKNNSQKLLSKENFEENGISLSFERDKCLQIQTSNGAGAEPVLCEFWSRDKETDFSTYETANMRIERGSRFGHPVGPDSRLFVFDLVNSKKSKERRPDIASLSSGSPLRLDFRHDHTCYRFIAFLQEKSAAEKMQEKERRLREEESNILKRLTKLRDELESIHHQYQQEEVPVPYSQSQTLSSPSYSPHPVSSPAPEADYEEEEGREMQVDSGYGFNLDVNPSVQVADESCQHLRSPPPSKRRKIEKQTPTKEEEKEKEEEEEEGEWPGFNFSNHHQNEAPCFSIDAPSSSLFPSGEEEFSFLPSSSSSSSSSSLDSSSNFLVNLPPPFLENSSSYPLESLFTSSLCNPPLFDSAESFFPPPTPHF